MILQTNQRKVLDIVLKQKRLSPSGIKFCKRIKKEGTYSYEDQDILNRLRKIYMVNIKEELTRMDIWNKAIGNETSVQTKSYAELNHIAPPLGVGPLITSSLTNNITRSASMKNRYLDDLLENFNRT